MGKQNDKAPENNKPKKTAYLVCDGAMCMCDSGAKPAKLKVTKNKKVYINEESKKLLATEMDWTFDPPSVPFGSCKNKPGQDKSCTPAFVKWDKPYDSISADGHKVITDKSELVCKAFQGKVTVLKHGQVQQVSAGQIANLNQVVASQVNPFAPPPKRTEPDYNVSVTGIEAEIPETESSKSLSGKKREKVLSKKKPANPKAPADTHPVNSILARPGEEVLFTAASKAGGSEALISWKVTNTSGGEPFYYLQEGKEFRTFFHDEGKYRVEAYGTGKDGRLDTEFDSDSCNVRKEYDDCSLFVEVKPNEIAQLKLSGDKSNIIPGSISQPDSVRAGIPVKIEAVFLHPPIKEDADKLILIVQDAEGNELGRVEGKHEFLFTPANTGAKYLAEARYTTAETEVKKTLEFKTISNAVSVIGGTITEGTMARPGTEIIFNVEKTTFSGEVKDFEGEQIKWKLAGSDEVLGRGTAFKKTFDREGDYIVEAYVNSSNAVMALFRGKGEADDWRFTITQNYITDIKFNGRPKVGRTILFTVDTLFKPTFQEKKNIAWSVSGPVNAVHAGEASMKVLFSQQGKYIIKASLNGKSKEITVECLQCEIHEGWWTDKDGNYLAAGDPDSDPSNTIGFAGWKQEVCASFKQTGLGGEKALIKVFDKDKLDEDDFMVSKEVTIPDKLLVGFAFELTDDLKKKAVSWLSNGMYANLYFTVEILDMALKVIKNNVALPLNPSWNLRVDDNPRCKAYFSDNNDTKRYSVASQTTPVFSQIKTTGYQDNELLVEIWESITGFDKKLLGELGNQKPDKFGMLSVPLDLKKIKLKDASETKQLYIKVLTKEDKEKIYSSDGKYTLALHQVLKTEAVSKGTTKAMVVVDVSKLEKIEEEDKIAEGCGISYRGDIQCTKYGSVYGPVYWGSLKLANYSQWGILITSGKITEEEKMIIIGMSENEGKLDSVQSYDSEIATVGAMQKTINPEGYGEFPLQMWEFKQDYPERFKVLFSNCGWDVNKEEEQNGKLKFRAYYNDKTGFSLKNKIREGFEESNYKTKVDCIPLEPLINAAKDSYFQAKQIEDFIDRLKNQVLEVKPTGHSYKLKEYLKSKLGKATALDHHINRPAHVASYFGASLNRFYSENPSIDKNPNTWGGNHSQYESIIVEDYGKTRSGTDMVTRYNNLKDKL